MELQGGGGEEEELGALGHRVGLADVRWAVMGCGVGRAYCWDGWTGCVW